MASVQEQINAEIKRAEQAGWMSNGLPVKVVDGRLVYDIDRIGAARGIPQAVIDQVKSINVPKIDRTVRPQSRDAWETSGAGDEYMRQQSARMRQLNKLNQLGPSAAVLHNLYNMDAGVQVNMRDENVLANLTKPGYMSGLRGPGGRFDLADRITQTDDPDWFDKWGKTAINIGAGIVIGSGIASQFGAFGEGTSLLGGSGPIPEGISGAVHADLVSGASGVGPGVGAGVSATSGSLGPLGGAMSGPGMVGGPGMVAGSGIDAATTVAEGATPGILSTAGGFGKNFIKENWPALVLGGGSAITDYLAGEKAADRAEDYNEDLMNWLSQQQDLSYERQQEIMKQAQDWYEKVSLPDPAAVEAARRTGMNTLGQGRSNAYTSMFNQLATRGFGSGSGIGYGQAQGIEGDYLKSLGTLEDQITRFGLTRQFAPGGQTYGFTPPGPQQVSQVSQPGGWESSLGTMSNILGNMSGMYAANNLLKTLGQNTRNWGP